MVVPRNWRWLAVDLNQATNLLPNGQLRDLPNATIVGYGAGQSTHFPRHGIIRGVWLLTQASANVSLVLNVDDPGRQSLPAMTASNVGTWLPCHIPLDARLTLRDSTGNIVSNPIAGAVLYLLVEDTASPCT